jgi:crotonobetainyl-CoA:carnitine CoA-transferase CaiB-like acyl-CoA transferase
MNDAALSVFGTIFQQKLNISTFNILSGSQNRLDFESIGLSCSTKLLQDGPPCKVGVAMTDLATGLYAHGAIMAALLERHKTGKGQKIECNLLSTQVENCLLCHWYFSKRF